MEVSGPLEPKASAKAPRWDPGTGCTERTLMLASRLGSEGKRKRSFAVPFESSDLHRMWLPAQLRLPPSWPGFPVWRGGVTAGSLELGEIAAASGASRCFLKTLIVREGGAGRPGCGGGRCLSPGAATRTGTGRPTSPGNEGWGGAGAKRASDRAGRVRSPCASHALLGRSALGDFAPAAGLPRPRRAARGASARTVRAHARLHTEPTQKPK